MSSTLRRQDVPESQDVPLSEAEGRRVLVVDDDAAIRDIVSETLADEGYQVKAAANGRVALDVLGTWRPDAIVLDLMMPEMDGWAFLARRQDDPALIDIPVLVMTAKFAAGGLGSHASGGLGGQPAVDVLAKPFELDLLIARVAALVP